MVAGFWNDLESVDEGRPGVGWGKDQDNQDGGLGVGTMVGIHTRRG